MASGMRSFFHGPNLFATQSGLVADADGLLGDQAAKWRPSEFELRVFFSHLRDAFPGAAGSADLATAGAIAGAELPLVDLLLATTEILVRDFCISPARGRLLTRRPGEFRVFIPCDEPAVGRAAWTLSILAVEPALAADVIPERLELLIQRYRDFRSMARGQSLNQSTLALARAAWKRGIPSYRIGQPGQILQLGQGRYRQRVMETSTELSSPIGSMVAHDKLTTNAILAAHGVPTPGSRWVKSPELAVEAAREIGFPVVVKPRGSKKGRGVSIGLLTEQHVAEAFASAAKEATGVLVERFVAGDDHRLLVVAGRFVAAARRMPAFVSGDGRQTVRQLVDEMNRDPRRGMPFERLLERVELDAEAERMLADAGLAVDSVPERGRHVVLRGASNISRGGVSDDVTDIIHPDTRLLSERVARLVGLDVVGLDFVTPDISRSWREVPCAILEVNGTPALRPHLGANPDHDVVAPIMDHLFPGDGNGRVPTVAITGSVGKTTTCTMVASILAEAGMTVARSTSQGAWIGTERIQSEDVAGGRMARNLLLDPAVEACVFEFARGGLVKNGMYIDRVDVGAVLNILDNHIGIDGVRTRRDLARIKQLVVQACGKMAVLNADDPLCLAMARNVAGKPLCLVSTKPDNPAVIAHLRAGGLVAYAEGAGPSREIILWQSGVRFALMPVAAIPSTYDGTFEPAIHNALFAAAIARGLGIQPATIRAALGKFQSTPETNPGRMNFIEGFAYSLLVTWADGSEAIESLAGFVGGLTGVGTKTLLIFAMGNRPDDYIAAMAHAASSAFDRFVCTDWTALRGRAPGEIATVLAQGLLSAGVPADRIAVAPDYGAALEMACSSASAGDLLVILNFDNPGVVDVARSVAERARERGTIDRVPQTGS